MMIMINGGGGAEVVDQHGTCILEPESETKDD